MSAADFTSSDWAWPAKPDGDMAPVLEASIEAAVAAAAKEREIIIGETTRIVLTATDRCDSCPAGAAYRVARSVNGIDRELDFCVHHWRKNKTKLDAEGWHMIAVRPEFVE